MDTRNMSAEEETRLNSVEKARIRMAAEGYKSLDNNSNGYNKTDREQLVEDKSSSSSSTDTSCSGLEKIMTGLLVVALLVVVALSILLVVHGFLYSGKQQCESAECVELSGSILKNMDLSAEPCDDFYQYSCGRFEEDPLIPPDEPKYSWFSYMDRRSKALLKRILDEDGSKYKGVESSAIAKAKLLYRVCMNETATENMGLDPLFKLIKEVGSWTVITNEATGTWDPNTFDIEVSLSKLHLHGMGALFSFSVGMDDKNTSVNRLQFDQGGLSFGDYTNYVGNNSEKFHKAFVEYFTSVAVLLGANESTSAKLGEDVWQFEKGIAGIQDTPVQRVDVKAMYHLMTLSAFQNVIGGDVFNLAEYLNYMFGEQISASEQVLVYATNYFSKLGDLMKKTSKETIANYMTFKVVQTTLSYLPQRYQAPRRRLRSLLIGTSATPPLWLTCSSRTEGTLGDAVGALYVDKYFSEEEKQKVEELLAKIVTQFKLYFPEVSWMDEQTRSKALEKINALGHKIGFPEYIKDPKKLDDRYHLLNLTNSTAFENFVSALQFGIQDNLDKRGKAPDPTRWSMAPTEVNAYYSPLWNQMVFPAAILEKPFYSTEFPMAINFGSMGFVMGHELTHGFDNTGRNFDKRGNMDNWWTNESAKNFEKKTKCLVDQYGKYKVGEGHLNGLTTLGENIADNGGLKNSYRAYHTWLKSHGFKEPATHLPGLNMTGNQLFFLTFAQTWCSYYTPEYAQRSLVTDVHSYARYRVIGTLSNIPEFSEAFKCKSGTNMNPVDKCSVW